MVCILFFVLRYWVDFRHSTLVLEAWTQTAAVIVLGLVLFIIVQPPYHRFMQYRIPGDIAGSAAIEREANVDPLVLFQLPSSNERPPFCTLRLLAVDNVHFRSFSPPSLTHDLPQTDGKKAGARAVLQPIVYEAA